jgi:hypothetical protein
MSVPPEQFHAPMSPPPGTTGQIYRVSLTKVTSFVIMTQQRRNVHTGTVEQLESAARAVLTHNLLFGWWGIPVGLVWTPIALSRNARNMKKIRSLAAGTPPSGLPPSGPAPAGWAG